MKKIRHWIRWIDENPTKGLLIGMVMWVLIFTMTLFNNPAIVGAIFLLAVAVVCLPFFGKLKKPIAVILSLVIFSQGFVVQKVRAEEKGGVGIGIGICVLVGVGIGVYVLNRKCSKWFGPKPDNNAPPSSVTNTPPASTSGVFKDNTNDYPICYCEAMNEPDNTNAPPYSFSMVVNKGKIEPLGFGTNGVVVTVGEPGHWVNLTEEEKETTEPPVLVLVEYTMNLNKPFYPFVLLLVPQGKPFTILDPVTAGGSGFYRTSIPEK